MKKNRSFWILLRLSPSPPNVVHAFHIIVVLSVTHHAAVEHWPSAAETKGRSYPVAVSEAPNNLEHLSMVWDGTKKKKKQRGGLTQSPSQGSLGVPLTVAL